MLLFFVPFFFTLSLGAREYHVRARGGDDRNGGTAAASFRTIGRAAAVAFPGDTITVHAGTYREWVKPPRGGLSESQRILYRAAPGEKAEIKGSEVIKGWKRFAGDVWKVAIPDSFFGEFNPYCEELHGDWFNDMGRIHHPGEVYLNGNSLYEASTLETVLQGRPLRVDEGELAPWYCEHAGNTTYLYAWFGENDPTRETVEIHVRQACFYPDHPGVDYLTVRGFIMRQAATPWAPPTAEQIGLLGTHWSKGWIIEDNVISDSKCVGITLGKDRKSGQNVWSKNPCRDGATHYNEVIFRALRDGWSKEKIGSHIVRRNTVYHCEQAGIVGSLGAVFSVIEENHIHDIWVKRLFTGAEIAGIKIHAPVDMMIRHNHLCRVGRGIWLDWMAQGVRVSANLCYDNLLCDLFVEVSHGPFLVDNNLFLSEESIRNWSEGGAFAHNLVAGRITALEVRGRFTPYLFPHSTRVKGLRNIWSGKNRFYNNLFLAPVGKKSGYGLAVYNHLYDGLSASGNVHLGASRPARLEAGVVRDSSFAAEVHLETENGKIRVVFNLPPSVEAMKREEVTSALLGVAEVPEMPFVTPEGKPLKIDRDYAGRERKTSGPSPGPFSPLRVGRNIFVVMDKKE